MSGVRSGMWGVGAGDGGSGMSVVQERETEVTGRVNTRHGAVGAGVKGDVPSGETPCNELCCFSIVCYECRGAVEASET